MPDQIAVAFATALAAKGAEALFTGGRNAVGALVRIVRERFGADTREGAVLQAAMERPDDPDRRTELAATLTRVMADDPAFADTVRRYWRGSVDPAERPGVVNTFTGNADKVVQAGDIRGDVNF